jgi:hypothetical protein
VIDEILRDLTPVLAAIATAGLTAHFGLRRWHAERRVRKVGLFVIPFLRACEDLQSRLYNVLGNAGIEPLRRRLSEDEIALELLFMVARYCGWERVLYEHGPDVGDKTFVRITQDIRQVLATDSSFDGIGPFCIFRTQQTDLGQLVVRRCGETDAELAFESLPSYEFRRRLEEAGLWQKPLVQDCLRDFERNLQPSRMRNRLVALQRRLVDLLEHLERREKICLFAPQSSSDARERLRLFDEVRSSTERSPRAAA